jgi:hypothetical protein
LAGTPVLGHSDRATTSASLRQLLGKVDIPHHAGQARDEPGPFNAKGRFDRLVRFACGHTVFFGQGRRGDKPLQPTVSGDAELPALAVTGRR